MGVIACLVSAAGFGLMAIFAKLAYADGVEPDALLIIRFALASAILAVAARLTGELRRVTRPTVVAGLLMGGVGYAAQSTLFFNALTFADASLVALLLSLYPLMVMVGANALGRERPSARRGLALLAALVGVALVLGGASTDGATLLGVVLALGAAVVYSGYILVGERVATAGTHLAFTACVCAGALVTFSVSTLLRGMPDLAFAPRGWLWLVLIAVVSTVGSIALFFVGLARVGPTMASMLSMIEPVVTVVAAALVFGEVLSGPQLIGALLVLTTVLAVRLPGDGAAAEGRLPGEDPGVRRPGPSPRRASGEEPPPRRDRHAAGSGPA